MWVWKGKMAFQIYSDAPVRKIQKQLGILFIRISFTKINYLFFSTKLLAESECLFVVMEFFCIFMCSFSQILTISENILKISSLSLCIAWIRFLGLPLFVFVVRPTNRASVAQGFFFKMGTKQDRSADTSGIPSSLVSILLNWGTSGAWR